MPTILHPCENQGNEFHMHVKLSELLSVRIDVLLGLGEEDGLGHCVLVRVSHFSHEHRPAWIRPDLAKET